MNVSMGRTERGTQQTFDARISRKKQTQQSGSIYRGKSTCILGQDTSLDGVVEIKVEEKREKVNN